MFNEFCSHCWKWFHHHWMHLLDFSLKVIVLLNICIYKITIFVIQSIDIAMPDRYIAPTVKLKFWNIRNFFKNQIICRLQIRVQMMMMEDHNHHHQQQQHHRRRWCHHHLVQHHPTLHLQCQICHPELQWWKDLSNRFLISC